MNSTIRRFVLAGILGSLAMAAGTATAATVTFSDFSDAVPKLFDIPTTVPDGGDPNTLIIGLDDFAVDGVSITAFDTLSFKITAPLGYRIVSLFYEETGAGTGGATGTAIATGSMTANGLTKSLASIIFGPGSGGGWALTTSFDYAGGMVTEVIATISNALVAVGDASIAKTGATLEVGIALIPIPASVLLLLSGLFGLAVVRRDSAART